MFYIILLIEFYLMVIFSCFITGRIIEVLTNTNHNGFPVVSEHGRVRGLILRKTLCGLLKLKAYSTPAPDNVKYNPAEGGSLKLDQAATVFYDTLERVYPNFPDVKAVRLSEKETVTCDMFYDSRMMIP